MALEDAFREMSKRKTTRTEFVVADTQLDRWMKRQRGREKENDVSHTSVGQTNQTNSQSQCLNPTERTNENPKHLYKTHEGAP